VGSITDFKNNSKKGLKARCVKINISDLKKTDEKCIYLAK
jgi:hypothetical protein